MTGRIFLTLVAGAVFIAVIWIGVVQYQQSRSNEEAARQEAEAIRRTAENLRQIGTGQFLYAEEWGSNSSLEPALDTRPMSELTAFHFLIGTWRGEKDGGLVEEVWSRPHGNAMMGMFRWLNAEGRSRMYELLTISREDDETILRLRHFTPKMIAWEEKDTPVELKLSESSDLRAVFVNVSESDRMERIVFHQPEAGKLTIDVEFREAADRAPLRFQLSAAE